MNCRLTRKDPLARQTYYSGHQATPNLLTNRHLYAGYLQQPYGAKTHRTGGEVSRISGSTPSFPVTSVATDPFGANDIMDHTQKWQALNNSRTSLIRVDTKGDHGFDL
jgi:hypothetical protein